MLDATKVLIGTPDQTTTGAILSAPLGTTLPTSATDTLDPAFTDSGYISEDGLTLGNDISTTDLFEWGGSLVRRLKESFSGTLSWAQLETTEESLRNAFGDENVTATAATTTHGNQVKVEIKGELPAAKSWIFRLKDGDNRMLIVVPNGQVSDLEDVSFVSSDAIMWGVSLACYPDSSNVSIYIYTDDGKITA